LVVSRACAGAAQHNLRIWANRQSLRSGALTVVNSEALLNVHVIGVNHQQGTSGSVTCACLLEEHKKEAAFVWRPHQYLVPRPLYPHPRGGIEILPRIVVRKGQSYGKLNFLDCYKFATIGAFLQRIVVSSLLSAHHYSIRPKVGRPSPSPDTPWLLHL
jgi:hypothetical protein